MCWVNRGFILVGASVLCHLSLAMAIKGIHFPMNSHNLFFIITGIPIRGKKKYRADLPIHFSSSSLLQQWAGLLFLSITFCNLKKRETYWLTPRRISLHSILSIQGALGFETIKLVSIWGFSARRKKLEITWIHLPCGPLLTSNHSGCQSQRRALYFNEWVSL